jgi:Ni,Fe-hydrogenase I cytochrome b subunit
VPAAIYNYEYAGKKYRVVADRKRGTVIGARPVSAVKVTLFILGILALIAAGVFLYMKYGKSV